MDSYDLKLNSLHLFSAAYLGLSCRNNINLSRDPQTSLCLISSSSTAGDTEVFPSQLSDIISPVSPGFAPSWNADQLVNVPFDSTLFFFFFFKPQLHHCIYLNQSGQSHAPTPTCEQGKEIK